MHRLTDAHDDEHDEEGVEHGLERRAEGEDDLSHLRARWWSGWGRGRGGLCGEGAPSWGASLASPLLWQPQSRPYASPRADREGRQGRPVAVSQVRRRGRGRGRLRQLRLRRLRRFGKVYPDLWNLGEELADPEGPQRANEAAGVWCPRPLADNI